VTAEGDGGDSPRVPRERRPLLAGADVPQFTRLVNACRRNQFPIRGKLDGKNFPAVRSREGCYRLVPPDCPKGESRRMARGGNELAVRINIDRVHYSAMVNAADLLFLFDAPNNAPVVEAP